MKHYDMLFQYGENGDYFAGTPSSGWFELESFYRYEGEEEKWRHNVLMSYDSNSVIAGFYVYCLVGSKWIITFDFLKHLNGEIVSNETKTSLLSWYPFCGWNHYG